MVCEKCGKIMDEGYSLSLHFAGSIIIKKMEVKEGSKQPNVYVCKNCGDIRLWIEPRNLD